jgi:hypothetical protein
MKRLAIPKYDLRMYVHVLSYAQRYRQLQPFLFHELDRGK